MVSGNRQSRGVSWFGVAALSALLGAAACGSSDGGSSGGYCATWEQRLHECGALGAGHTGCGDYKDAAEPCETACVRDASCADIVVNFCGGASNNAMNMCLLQCIGEPTVTCGNGTKLPGYLRCNGSSDCSDGSDEEGCTATGMKCRNVDEYIPSEKRCDGVEDCSDGSDEYKADCAIVMSCNTDGSSVGILAQSVCNGISECDDGSDEPAECGAHQCGAAQP